MKPRSLEYGSYSPYLASHGSLIRCVVAVLGVAVVMGWSKSKIQNGTQTAKAVDSVGNGGYEQS